MNYRFHCQVTPSKTPPLKSKNFNLPIKNTKQYPISPSKPINHNKYIAQISGRSPQGSLNKSQTFQDILARTINHDQESRQSRSLIIKRSLNKQHKYYRNNQRKNSIQTSRPLVQKQRRNRKSVSRDITQRPCQRRRINQSIMQRINSTLQFYQQIFDFSQPKINKIQFFTQSDDQSEGEQKINFSKLVLWSQKKLKKMVCRLYESLMGSCCPKDFHKKPTKFEENKSIGKLIKTFFMAKFKTEKLSRQNFINLCYSLYYHLDRIIYDIGLFHREKQQLVVILRCLQVFQRFLNLKYDYQDLVFYLYSKFIITHVLRADVRNYQQILKMNLQQVKQFLVILCNNDGELVTYYQNYLLKEIKSNHFQLHTTLYYMLIEFSSKKEREKSIDFISSPCKQQKTPNQLNPLLYYINYDTTFWITDPPKQESINQTLYQRLLLEIGYQVRKLVNLVCLQLKLEHKDIINELLLIKAIRLLNIVHLMNKTAWFQEVGLMKSGFVQANSKDITNIEELQKDLLKIEFQFSNNGNLQNKSLTDFSKKLLTTRILINKLQELVQEIQIFIKYT